MTRMARWMVAIAVAAIPASVAARTGDDPLALVKAKYDEIQAVVKKYPEKAAMQKGIKDVMETFVDYKELGKRTLMPHWDKLKRAEQDDFVKEFKQMIQRTYVKRFDPDKEVRIEYKGDAVMAGDGTATVDSVVHSGRSEARVVYRFHKAGGKWMAFDVAIDDVSMVQNYRKQFHDIMTKNAPNGYPELMKKIRNKNAKAQE